MKKPLVIFALLGALVGCAILGTCVYHEWAFGNGNFNQVVYITKVDPVTKTVDRNWAEVPTAERAGVTFVNMWAVGAMFLLPGPVILAMDHSFRGNKHF
jgi:hypothetical protein